MTSGCEERPRELLAQKFKTRRPPTSISTPCGDSITRSRLVRPPASISASVFAKISRAGPYMSGLGPEAEQHLRVRGDALLEALLVERGEVDDRPLPAVEDHVVDEVVDVGVSRLEEVLRDVP